MRANKTFEVKCRNCHARLTWVLTAAGLLYLGGAAPKALAQTAAQLISTRTTAVPLPADGNGASVDPLISSDGRFVLYESTADNLTPGSGSGPWLQVYLRDCASNTTTLVSANLSGFGGNGHSTYGGMSADSRYVVFQSDASDLVAGDTNVATDIFVRDLVAGTTVLASVSTAGIEGNARSTSPVITPDGRYVAFLSRATNLVDNDTNGLPGLFVRDLALNTTILVTVGATNSANPPPFALFSGISFLSPRRSLLTGGMWFSRPPMAGWFPA